MTPPIFPCIDDSLFIPDVIDFNLQHNAEQPCFIYAETPDKITTITHLEFGRAAHRVARALRPGRSGVDGQVVAFIALADTLLYHAITTGLIVSGLVPFPISPRNSAAAVVDLLQKSQCHRLITTQVTLKPLIDGIKAHIETFNAPVELHIEEIPSLSTIYPYLGHETADDPFERYPAPSRRPSKDQICVYLHSSGSTGFPKVIPQTNLAWAHWASFPVVTDFRDHVPRLIIASMHLPPFHTLGVCAQLLNALYGVTPVALYPPTATSEDKLPVMPTPENVLEHTRRTKANSMTTIPALLQIWSTSAEDVEVLKKLELVTFSGGGVTPKLGDLLVNSGVRLRPIYGSTECGATSYILPRKGDEKDWQYIQIHERANVRWMPQGDGTFECQILSWEKHRPMVENLVDPPGYATSDLFEEHPTKKYLRKVVGRIDDVIVHSSGEKTVPAPMEDVVTSSPIVQGTVMFGRERDQPGILIEPRPNYEIDVNDHVQLAALRNDLWPVIEEANRNAPAFSRIFKEMILITAKDKPLPRAGKGTVMRKAALTLYEDEIDALYETVETNTKAAGDFVLPATWTDTDVETWLIQQAIDLISADNISPSVDLFEQGFDSLSATFLRHRIVGALRSSGNPVARQAVLSFNQNFIYAYPSIKQLTIHIVGLLSHLDEPSVAMKGHAHIEQMIEKYSEWLQPLPDRPPISHETTPAVVLLTGSSGNLGSQLLATLLIDERVKKIYALNRPTTPGQTMRERHLARFKDRGLDVALLDSKKLVFLSGDLTQTNLGLDRGGYGQICGSVNIIIHNAWKLDFNMSLSSFEPHIKGTRHLIDLARSGPNARNTRFLFTSSVASAQSWNHLQGPYPETLITDASVAVGGGYGEGKYVAEMVLSKSGLKTTSLKIGQISGGAPKGAWATTDWLPILVKSSLVLGALPTAEGVVSWLPMDAVANAIVEVAFVDKTPPTTLNVLHPRPIRWISVISYIKDALKKRLAVELPIVPFHDWVSRLEVLAKDESPNNIISAPGIKLIDFFRGVSHANNEAIKSNMTDMEVGGLPAFATNKMQEISATIRELGQLQASDAVLWVEYWKAVNFIG